jgi:hypothetical protein
LKISARRIFKQAEDSACRRGEGIFCPDSAVTELIDTPGVYVVDDGSEMLLLDALVTLAFDFVNHQVRQQSKWS